MGVWDLLWCLARQPKWPLAVVKGDQRADMVREKSHWQVTDHRNVPRKVL